MKKRIVSAFLALIMFAGCFALSGCSKEEEEEGSAVGQRIAMTLTMWLPAAEGTEVDDESVAQVEKAVNEITQAQFSTAIKLKVIPADEYDTKVLSKIKASKEEEIRQSSRKPEGEVLSTGIFENVPAYTEEPDNDFAVMNAAIFANYPTVGINQFDIFLVHGYEELTTLADEGLLSELDDNLSDDSKKLYSYIYPTFLTGVKYQESTFAIPNNRAIGKYEFMLINKEIASALSYDPSRFTSVDSLFTYDNSGVSFIQDAASYIAEQGLNVDAVAGTYEPPYLKYFNSKDNGEFSVISAYVGYGVEAGSVSIVNTFRNANYVNATRNAKRISETVTPVPFESSEEFAVGFTSGTAEDMKNYSEKYQVTVIQNPQPSTEEIFKSMFAVSSYTKDVDRSMEIITFLNTSTELRTILQYGVKGTHWREDVDDTNVIEILSDKYKMDIEETGNVYMTYPGEGLPLSYWDTSKAHNKDSFLPLTSGFNYVDSNTAPLLEELEEISADINARVQAMSSTEFSSSLESLRKEIDEIEAVKKLTFVVEDDKDPGEFNVEESLDYMFKSYIDG